MISRFSYVLEFIAIITGVVIGIINIGVITYHMTDNLKLAGKVSGIILGIVTCLLTSPLVGKILKKALKVELIPPDEEHRDIWNEITGGEEIGQPGKWLGSIERILVFFAVWIGEYTIIAALLAFKVAAKWEVWKNIVNVPASMPEINDNLAYLRSRRIWGAKVFSGFTIGTFLNVLIGFILAVGIRQFLIIMEVLPVK